MYKINFIQAFNSVRIFLDLYNNEHKIDNLFVLNGALRMWPSAKRNWEIEPQIMDRIEWINWTKAISDVLGELDIEGDIREIIYNEEILFSCLKKYLKVVALKYDWPEVRRFVDILNKIELVEPDPLWGMWIESVNHALRGTYELDVFYDPFTYEKM